MDTARTLPTSTYALELLHHILENIKPEYEMLTANFSSSGVEAVVVDVSDGKKYNVNVKPVDDSEEKNE